MARSIGRTCGAWGFVWAAVLWAGSVRAQEDVLILGGPIEFNVQPLEPTARLPADVLFVRADDEEAEKEAKRSEYWLGVQIAPLPEVAKQQLGIESGLTVEEVVPDSPAAKAEIKKYDILLKAGDVLLKEASDLIKSVDGSLGKEFTITIVRGGKEIKVTAAATKRPEKERFEIRVPQPELKAEIKRLEEALESLKLKAGDGSLGLWFARPGFVQPKIDFKGAPFPKDLKGELLKNLSVQINKEGDQPTKIHVKRDDKEWDVTEDKLGDLPEDIRLHVQALLGRMIMPGLAAAAKRTVRVSPEGKVEGELRIAPLPPSPPVAPRAPVAPVAPAPPAIPSVPYRSGVLPSPQPVSPVPALPPGRNYSSRELEAIMRKLEQIESGTLDKIDREVRRLRQEIDELKTKSPGDAKK
jgi:PDZ domain